MMAKYEDNSSSSDDEILVEAFKEACDEQFLPQSLFTAKDSLISASDTKVKAEIRPSLRVTERSDNFENFGVSQSFKDYVAKKLESAIERSIVHRDGDNNEEIVPKKKRRKENRQEPESGIKLLGSSNEIITGAEESKRSEPTQCVKHRNSTGDSAATNRMKCQEVAVDANWILSKNETKSWSGRSKGALFKYKKSCDGVLTEQRHQNKEETESVPEVYEENQNNFSFQASTKREGEYVDREEYRVSRSADIMRLTDPATDLLAPAPRHRYQGNMEKVAAARWDIYARYEEAAKQGEPVFISAEVCVYTLSGRTLPQHNYDQTERAFTRLWNRGMKKSTADGITKFGVGTFFNDISMFLVAF